MKEHGKVFLLTNSDFYYTNVSLRMRIATTSCKSVNIVTVFQQENNKLY